MPRVTNKDIYAFLSYQNGLINSLARELSLQYKLMRKIAELNEVTPEEFESCVNSVIRQAADDIWLDRKLSEMDFNK